MSILVFLMSPYLAVAFVLLGIASLLRRAWLLSAVDVDDKGSDVCISFRNRHYAELTARSNGVELKETAILHGR